MANVTLHDAGLGGVGFLNDMMYVFADGTGVTDVTPTTADASYHHAATEQENYDATFEVAFTGTDLNTASGKVTSIDFNIDGEATFTISDVSIDFTLLSTAIDNKDYKGVIALFKGISWNADFSDAQGPILAWGTGGSDNFKFGSGDDTFYVDGGDDVVEMGAGSDQVILGSAWSTGAGTSTIIGGSGDDIVFLSYNGDEYFNKGQTINMAKLDFKDGNHSVVLKGFEHVVATKYDDVLKGSKRADIMEGSDGDNTLTGGGGADTLTSGSGHDLFVYKAVSDSAYGKAFDTINTFVHNEDKIDLSKIDPDNKAGAFHFVGKQDLHKAGDLHFYQHDDPMQDNPFDDYTVIEANVDGKGGPDIEIHLLGLVDLTKSDFIL